MSLRVLHILNDLRGGATMSAIALMREGRRRDSGIEHFAVYPGRLGQRAAAFEGVATDWCAVPIRTWQKQRWQSPVSMLRWLKTQMVSGLGARGRRYLRDLVQRWNIDVIHTNTAIVNDGALVARELEIPHLWHIRERLGAGGFMEFRLHGADLVRYISSHSVMIPVISGYVREVFARHGLENATVLVHDGIEISRFQEPDVAARGRALRERWGVPDEALLVGMVGGLKTVVKRHDLFLEMASVLASRHPDVRFAILGGIPPASERGPNTWAGRILARADQPDLRGRVVFPGFEEDMAAVWAAMDVYVHLCEIEGFSRAILEAMASGTPVVAIASGGNPEAIRHRETGVLVERQAAALYADCVDELLQSPELRDELSRRAATTVRKRFAIGAHYDTMRDLFERVAAGESSRHTARA